MIGADQGGSSSSQASQIQKSSKASRAGTRTSRIVRIIRLVRLIRIVRLYKSASKVINNSDSDNEDGHEEAIPKESQVGKKLSDLTIKRVIILVLVLLFFLPLFDTEFYLENYHS